MSVNFAELDVELTGSWENRKATLDKLRASLKITWGCTQRWRFYFSPDGEVSVRSAIATKYLSRTGTTPQPLGNKVHAANRRRRCRFATGRRCRLSKFKFSLIVLPPPDMD